MLNTELRRFPIGPTIIEYVPICNQFIQRNLSIANIYRTSTTLSMITFHLQNVRHYHDKNMIISPLSIETALALLYCGTGGRTADEMSHALDLYPMTQQQVAGNFSEILGPLSKTRLVNIANAIYIQNGFQIRSNFQNVSVQDFNSNVQNIDFGDSSNATAVINAWVANKTANQITSLFGANSLPPSTNLVLANAINFKGFWQTPFPKANTKAGQFRYGKCKANEVETVQMMNVQVFECSDNFKWVDTRSVNNVQNRVRLGMVVSLTWLRTSLNYRINTRICPC